MTPDQFSSLQVGDCVAFNHILGTVKAKTPDGRFIIDWEDWNTNSLPNYIDPSLEGFRTFIEAVEKLVLRYRTPPEGFNSWREFAVQAKKNDELEKLRQDVKDLELNLSDARDTIYCMREEINRLREQMSWLAIAVLTTMLVVLVLAVMS